MKSLLIYPSHKFKEYRSLRPPLGLAYIAAYAEREGHDVKVLDLGVEEQELSESFIKGFDLIGISVLTSHYSSAARIVKDIRRFNKDVPIVFGGPHPSVMPEVCLKNNDINVVVRHEGEETFKEVLQHYEGKMGLSEIKGISYKKDGNIVNNADRELIKDLDDIPPPARHLLKMDKYHNKIHGKPITSIITSRGCPYRCVFCFKTMGPNWRGRSPKLIIDEVESVIDAYGVTSFFFHDDLFTNDRERVFEICNEITRRELNITWLCNSRVNTVDAEVLDAMKNAGCVQIHYGIESGDEEVLKKMGKGVRKEDARNALKLTHDAGIYCKAFFLIGFPWETSQSIQNSIDFIKSVEVDEVLLNVVTPYPGTYLWGELLKRENVDPFSVDWDDFFSVSPDHTEKAWFTDNLSQEELSGWKKRMYKQIILNKLWRKVKALDFKYIFNIVREKKDVGMMRFMRNTFLR